MGFPPHLARITPAQRLEVLAAACGGSFDPFDRQEVFGDARYRGRVERIVAAKTPSCPSPQEGATGLDGKSLLEAIRILYVRRLGELLASGVTPSMSELQKQLEVQRRLEAFEQLERLRKPSARRVRPPTRAAG